VTLPKKSLEILNKLDELRQDLAGELTHRDDAARVLVLGALCHEHVLLLGPPGTAKTDLVNRFAAAIDAPRFHYLLTRFTEPSEIFGPLDLRKFEAGEIHIKTEGMLPDAAISFLDEIFHGGSAILNTLLTLVHERVFHNGSTRQPVPLISLIGASNDLPEDTTLRAFADRFALRVMVNPVPEHALGKLLDAGWNLEKERMQADASALRGQVVRPISGVAADDIRTLHGHLKDTKLGEVRTIYEQVVRELRAEGVELSDRRIVKGMKLIAGAALLSKRDTAEPQDLWPLTHAWSRVTDAPVVTGVIERHVSSAEATAPPARPASEITKDLERLEAQVTKLRTETALGAHLMTLGRLRREVLVDHTGETALRARIEAAVQTAMKRMEGEHV